MKIALIIGGVSWLIFFLYIGITGYREIEQMGMTTSNPPSMAFFVAAINGLYVFAGAVGVTLVLQKLYKNFR